MRKIANQYVYEGPVYLFDKLIAPMWCGQTYAVSEAKARSNLEFQVKKIYGYTRNAKVKLPGQVVLVY